MTTLIAEDLLLLLLDDESGKLTATTYLDTGIGGAVLVELAMAGCVDVVKGSGLWARAKVLPTNTPPPADPVLTEAWELIRSKERTAQDLVARLGKRRRDGLLLPASGAWDPRGARGPGARPDPTATVADGRGYARSRRTPRAR